MKVILFGATGMVGQGVLLEAQDDPRVSAILSIGRSAPGPHPKLTHIAHDNLLDLSPIEQQLSGYDACFYCLGTTSAGTSEEAYTQVTYGYTVSVVTTLQKHNPDMVFNFVSGQGTDASERGRTMWARVKGRAENAVKAAGFKKAILFRPGLIVPKRGIKSKTALYQVFFDYFMWLLKLIQWISPHSVTDTTRIGKAMIAAVEYIENGTVLHPKHINALAEIAPQS